MSNPSGGEELVDPSPGNWFTAPVNRILLMGRAEEEVSCESDSPGH